MKELYKAANGSIDMTNVLFDALRRTESALDDAKNQSEGNNPLGMSMALGTALKALQDLREVVEVLTNQD